MKRLVVLSAILFGATTAGFLAGVACSGLKHVTLVSLSPDETYRVHLVEVGVWIDRNFQLRLERLADRSTKMLFLSPDEGRPVGSERIVWSPDSRRFLLLGRHFFVREDTPSLGGQSLYLLYDVSSRKLWCNSKQQSDYSPFGIREVGWDLPIESTSSTLTPGR